MRTPWSENTRALISEAMTQISTLSEWAREANLPAHVAESMTEPYRQIIETAYREDLPFAEILDESDFVIGVDGDQIQRGSASVNVMAELFTDARTNLTKLVHAAVSPGQRLLAPLSQLHFYQFAPGSVYLGFKVVEPEHALEFAQKAEAESIRSALRTLGMVTKLLDEGAPPERFDEIGPHKDVVDAALKTVFEFTPSQKSPYTQVRLGGNGLSLEDYGQRAPVFTLTQATREKARNVLSRSKGIPKNVALEGSTQAIDLEQGTITIKFSDQAALRKASIENWNPGDPVKLRRILDESESESDDTDLQPLFPEN
jgi:hypothetical protein